MSKHEADQALHQIGRAVALGFGLLFFLGLVCTEPRAALALLVVLLVFLA